MFSFKNRLALITGSSGFIGYHVTKKLLEEDWKVVGIDNMSNYYDVSLKEKRLERLKLFNDFEFFKGSIEKKGFVKEIVEQFKPNLLIHLAAQAGVRYSLNEPRSYMESNILGSFEILEAVRNNPPEHMLLASTSSVYGANTAMPYSEDVRADNQLSFYAATKKSMENIAHSYSHLYDIPTTIFRFFTVYGPWGRPDMAIFKFTDAICNDRPIEVFNYGHMKRDFTYIDDLVDALYLLTSKIPKNVSIENDIPDIGVSPAAPFRVVNIGNSSPVSLSNFIEAIEKALGKKAKKNMLPMQQGDVSATWANTEILNRLTGYIPKTSLDVGINEFVKWYLEHFENSFIKKA